MGFMTFKLAKKEQQWKRGRNETVLNDPIVFFFAKDCDKTLDRVDIDDMIVVVDHESEDVAEIGKLGKGILFDDGVDFLCEFC